MKTLSRQILMITLATALSTPVALLAAEKAAPTQPPPAQMQARMQAMQARMHALQQTEGEARMPMMAATGMPPFSTIRCSLPRWTRLSKSAKWLRASVAPTVIWSDGSAFIANSPE